LKRVVTSSGVAEITLRNGRTVKRHKDGSFHMGDAAAKAAVKGDGGFIIPEMGPARRGVGYICSLCGRGSYFTTCGKCGGECHRETDA
jgi:hypothetical protein